MPSVSSSPVDPRALPFILFVFFPFPVFSFFSFSPIFASSGKELANKEPMGPSPLLSLFATSTAAKEACRRSLTKMMDMIMYL
jgi:hypothetical protein